MNIFQSISEITPQEKPKVKRRPFKRSKWSIRIVRDGKDKGDYWIVHDPNGKYKTRLEAREAKKIMVKDKSNVNSWANYSDYDYYN